MVITIDLNSITANMIEMKSLIIAFILFQKIVKKQLMPPEGNMRKKLKE